MTNIKLIQQITTHLVIVVIKTEHGDREIAFFLNVAQLFVFKVRKELEAADWDSMSVAKRKAPNKHPNTRISPSLLKVKTVYRKNYLWGYSIQVLCDAKRIMPVCKKKG